MIVSIHSLLIMFNSGENLFEIISLIERLKKNKKMRVNRRKCMKITLSQ